MYPAILLSFAAIVTTAAAYKVTYANFASHEANKASPYYDLFAWGIHGGQLPKGQKPSANQTFVYMPDDSYAEFQKIMAGERNLTDADPENAARAVRTLTRAEQGLSFPRGEKRCESMIFKLVGSACVTNFYDSCINPSTCWVGNCSWLYIVVYYNSNSFVTFWQSPDCDGHHGSFNPVCDDADDQVCTFNFQPSFFETKTDCHRQYSSDGCTGTSP